MQLKNVLSDDDAVSPVIGVILMVAITVILAAVIASFVLGLGDQAQQTTPQASFSFDFDATKDPSASYTGDFTTNLESSGADADNGALKITHDGGDTIDGARLTLNDGNDGPTEDYADGTDGPGIDDVTAGDTVAVGIDKADTVRVLFEGESGDSSATLAKYSGPDA